MSLEQAVAANTEALNRLTAMLSGGQLVNAAAVAQVAPAPQAPPLAPPVAPTPPMQPPAGMPPAPFGGTAPAAPAAAPLPFNDAQGLLVWAEGRYKALAPTDPSVVSKLTAILQQHGLDQSGISAAQPHQFASLHAAIAALG